MITKNPLCRVEIFYHQGNLIMFDFGNPGIIIEVDELCSMPKLIPYVDGEYSEKYSLELMKLWSERAERIDVELVDAQVFYHLKEMLSALPWCQKTCDIVSGLLRRHFERYLRLYGI